MMPPADTQREVRRGNVFRIAPPLTVTSDEIDEGVSIIDQALTECGK
jgi:4-aminobutyrate aminotransferase-like enzyme